MNYSYKRILAPYFSKDKLAIITKKIMMKLQRLLKDIIYLSDY